MARANLNINANISEEFFRAQDSSAVRLLKIRIEGENLVLDGVVNRVGTAQQDFDTILADSLSDTLALFFLFCVTDDDYTSRAWMLMAWVPDGCRVRDKMLYSSSREDLKRSLGLGYFKSEYYANLKSDVTWVQFQESLDKNITMDILTDTERLVLEEKALTQVESVQTRSTAMGVMPFQLTAEVVEKLQAFKTDQTNWIEMTVEEETVQYVSSGRVAVGDSFQSLISAERASFVGIRLPNSSAQLLTFFIFCCPENVPVRSKMTMSSSKASVLAAAQQQGVSFDRALEVRGVDEIDDLLSSELSPPDSAGVSSSAASLSHSKPHRPGRGKAKVSKFKADEGTA